MCYLLSGWHKPYSPFPSSFSLLLLSNSCSLLHFPSSFSLLPPSSLLDAVFPLGGSHRAGGRWILNPGTRCGCQVTLTLKASHCSHVTLDLFFDLSGALFCRLRMMRCITLSLETNSSDRELKAGAISHMCCTCGKTCLRACRSELHSRKRVNFPKLASDVHMRSAYPCSED